MRKVPEPRSGRGLNNQAKMAYVVVNLAELEEREVEGEVTPDTLRDLGLTRKKGLVKVLGDGELNRKIDLKIHAISKVAKEKIEKAGGSVEIISE